MSRLKCLVVVATVVVVAAGGKAWAETSNQDVTLTVAPIVASVFAISPNTYDFRNVDLAISSVTTKSITPEINNNGTVGLTFEKTVTTDDDWTLATSTGTINEFVLWAMTKTTQAAWGDFGTDYETATSSFSTTLNQYNNLNTDADAQVDLEPGNTAKLYFRIDMPSEVTNANTRTITARIRGTTK